MHLHLELQAQQAINRSNKRPQRRTNKANGLIMTSIRAHSTHTHTHAISRASNQRGGISQLPAASQNPSRQRIFSALMSANEPTYHFHRSHVVRYVFGWRHFQRISLCNLPIESTPKKPTRKITHKQLSHQRSNLPVSRQAPHNRQRICRMVNAGKPEKKHTDHSQRPPQKCTNTKTTKLAGASSQREAVDANMASISTSSSLYLCLTH